MKKSSLLGVFIALFATLFFGSSAFADTTGTSMSVTNTGTTTTSGEVKTAPIHMLKEACSISYIQYTGTNKHQEQYDLGNISIRFGKFCGESGFWINEKPFIDTLGVLDIRSTDKTFTLVTSGMEITCDSEKVASFWPKKPVSWEQSLTGEAKKTLQIIKSLPNSSPSALANALGYSRRTDRKALAKEAGIHNYRGTAAQNVKIQTYLLMKKGLLASDGKIVATTTKTISVSPVTYKQMKQERVSQLVNHWEYYWPLHRAGLAQEFISAVAEKVQTYQGSHKQNISISTSLLKKAVIK